MPALGDMEGTFTAPEIEAALELQPRTIELLRREGQMMQEVVRGRRGVEARYDARATFRVVLASVLEPLTGGSIVSAQRLTAAIAPALEGNHFTLPYGGPDLGLEARAADPNADIYAPGHDRACPMRTITAARRADIDVLSPRRNDFTLVIFDGRLVGHSGWNSPLAYVGTSCPVQPLLTFHRPARGAVSVEPIESEAAEAHFLARAATAESVLRINVARAIRRALVAIADRRQDMGRPWPPP